MLSTTPRPHDPTTPQGVKGILNTELESISDPSSSLSINNSILWLIGGVLFVTAAAKLWMLLTDSFSDVRVGISKEILWLSVALEFWLAWENFRSRNFSVMAFVNTIVFACFAIFSLSRWLTGYSSCGCSGNMELPIWFFILIDVIIVTWFMRSPFARVEFFRGFQQIRKFWNSIDLSKRGRWAGFAVLLIVLVAIQFSFATPVRSMLFGSPMIKAIVSFDEKLSYNRESTGVVEIINNSRQSAKIIGMSRSCRCFDLADSPISMSIPASDRLVLPLVIKPIKSGPLHQRVELYLDHPKQFRVDINVVDFVSGEKR